MLLDVKKGVGEIVDFSNAELGEKNLLMLFELLPLNLKLKQLKLNNNKMNDECVGPLLVSLKEIPSLTNINLGQNLLSEASIDQIIKAMESHPNFKRIILSQNKINERNVRERISKTKKEGISITL